MRLKLVFIDFLAGKKIYHKMNFSGFQKILIWTLVLIPSFLIAQPTFRGESVEYDYQGKRWFTSDNGTAIVQRDSTGATSYFGTNTKASHGMEIMGNTLFACEGSTIYGYDLTTELEVMQLNVPGAGFLNGLTNNGTDKLWATDFSNRKIFEIDVTSLLFPTVNEIVGNTVSTPNGIVYDSLNNRLIFVNWSSSAAIKAVDLNGFAVTTLTTTSLGNIDGIDEDGLGHYYISSWSPTRISRYDTNFVAAPVTITAPGINNPADICYAIGIDTLGIPNGGGPASFIGFGAPTVAIGTGLQSEKRMRVFPNPVSESSYVEFFVSKTGPVKLEIVDIRGRKAMTLLDESMASGQHFVLFQGLDLSAGTYFIRLNKQDSKGTEVLKVIVK